MSDPAPVFRATFLAAVAASPDVPLLFSGGVDSSTILAASLELGRRPQLVTFTYGVNRLSEDAALAERMAASFALPLRTVRVPREPEASLRDVRRVLAIIRRATKVHVQCSLPFLYLGDAVRELGHSDALMGMAADDLWGTGRRGSEVLQDEGEEAFRLFRAEKFFDEEQSDYSVMKVALSRGVTLHDPWRDGRVADVMLSLDSAQMHRPKTKHLALRAFPEFWRRGAWYRKNKSLQVVSGIRDAHDALLAHPINRSRHKGVLGLYGELLQEVAR